MEPLPPAIGNLHDRIRGDIEARIMSGAWGPGHRIPYEHELMEDYACSRMTVNKALSSLVERGLLDRRKRAGTFVSVPRLHRAALDIPDVSSEIVARGQRYRLLLANREERPATAVDQAQLEMAVGQVLALDCIHHADERPHALEQRLINLETVPAAREVDFAIEPPGAWLLSHVPWTDARHRITAIGADEGTAKALAIAPGAACLSLERWTWRTAERITYVRQIHPGAGYELVARFLA